jgi:hypothetical protein
VSRHAPKWSFPAAGSFQGVRTFREKRSQDGKRSQDRVLSNLAARVGLGQVPLGFQSTSRALALNHPTKEVASLGYRPSRVAPGSLTHHTDVQR